MATGVENAKATVAMRGTLLAIVMHTMCAFWFCSICFSMVALWPGVCHLSCAVYS